MTRSFRSAARVIKREPSDNDNPGDHGKAKRRGRAVPPKPDNDAGEDWVRIEL